MRRGTIWWTMQSIAAGGLTVALVILAFWKPSTGATVAAVAALILGPILVCITIKQIKNLRHEFRTTDEDLQQVD